MFEVQNKNAIFSSAFNVKSTQIKKQFWFSKPLFICCNFHIDFQKNYWRYVEKIWLNRYFHLIWIQITISNWSLTTILDRLMFVIRFLGGPRENLIATTKINGDLEKRKKLIFWVGSLQMYTQFVRHAVTPWMFRRFRKSDWFLINENHTPAITYRFPKKLTSDSHTNNPKYYDIDVDQKHQAKISAI